MFRVENLHKKYGSCEVLKGISFEIESGSIYGFLGPNGAGKTTTMNILAGLIDYNEGDIYFDGENFKNNKRKLLRMVSYLPQEPVFYNYMTGPEYLRFIGEINNLDDKEIKKKTEQLLDIVGLKDVGNKKIGSYSGGMRQRFGIAAALFKNPRILLLDEPTSALDPEGRADILELIKNLKDNGTTVFLSTHILNDVERICSSVSILNKGEIVTSGRIDEIKGRYIQPVFDIQFAKEPCGLKEKIECLPWIEKVGIKGELATVYVNDLEEAKKELLKLIVNEGNIVESFNIRKSTLEDIFIRLVNKNGNI